MVSAALLQQTTRKPGMGLRSLCKYSKQEEGRTWFINNVCGIEVIHLSLLLKIK